RWLWRGYLALGSVTLLTSRWKSGKTTLTSVLLARMKAGGALAGLPVAAGRAVVLSEEPSEQWLLRGRRLDLEDHIGWFCRPFRGRPTPAQWHRLLDRVAEVAAERNVTLLVVDPLSAFFPGKSENDAAAMLDALAPLQQLASRGLSVLALHHPAKKEHDDGPSGRGSGALLGSADILMEMRWYRRVAGADRRRRLIALSRFDDTPRELVVELNADGSDYLSHGGFADEEFTSQWQVLEGVLRQAERKLTRGDIRARWPSAERPDRATLYRWLRRAVERGLLRQDGLGKCQHPFRYWLADNEERWRKDPLALIHMPELFRPSPPG
ncbi:MAG TPA: AAA family ATPase, partial [Gemmataceae bacterium]